jgi:hypothetical protein
MTNSEKHIRLLEMNSRLEFGQFLNDVGLLGTGAEIGVAFAPNAKQILDTWHGEAIYLIDPYIEFSKEEYVDPSRVTGWEECWEYAHEMLLEHKDRCIWLRVTSDEAQKILSRSPQLDFVYIDGNHHQPQIGRDLENYWPLVKSGGILCGHDYYNYHGIHGDGMYICEVEDAVNEFVKKNNLELIITRECSSWWIIKK